MYTNKGGRENDRQGASDEIHSLKVSQFSTFAASSWVLLAVMRTKVSTFKQDPF